MWVVAFIYVLYLSHYVMAEIIPWQLNLTLWVISGIIMTLFSYSVVNGLGKYRWGREKTLEERMVEQDKNHPELTYVTMLIRGWILLCAIGLTMGGIIFMGMGVHDFVSGPKYYEGHCVINHQPKQGKYSEYYKIELSDQDFSKIPYHLYDIKEKYGQILIDSSKIGIMECKYPVKLHYLPYTVGIIDITIDNSSIVAK